MRQTAGGARGRRRRPSSSAHSHLGWSPLPRGMRGQATMLAFLVTLCVPCRGRAALSCAYAVTVSHTSASLVPARVIENSLRNLWLGKSCGMCETLKIGPKDRSRHSDSQVLHDGYCMRHICFEMVMSMSCHLRSPMCCTSRQLPCRQWRVTIEPTFSAAAVSRPTTRSRSSRACCTFLKSFGKTTTSSG